MVRRQITIQLHERHIRIWVKTWQNEIFNTSAVFWALANCVYKRLILFNYWSVSPRSIWFTSFITFMTLFVDLVLWWSKLSKTMLFRFRKFDFQVQPWTTKPVEINDYCLVSTFLFPSTCNSCSLLLYNWIKQRSFYLI